MPHVSSITLRAIAFVAVMAMVAVTPVLAAQYGTVEGIITWQYNDYVGTKGDVGAKVVLFPEKLKRKIKVTDEDLVTEIGSGILLSDAETIGLRGVSADGYGKVVVDDVKPGHYLALIISDKTTRDVSAPVSEDELSQLEKYFESKAAFRKLAESLFLKLRKSWIEIADVKAGRTTHLNHDFGNSYL